MRILAHRGFWKDPAEKNGRVALQRAFDCRFGVETDIRDHCGNLVIAHDKPSGVEMSFEEFLSIVPAVNGQEPAPLALNIKADGLAADIARLMRDYPASGWYVFDMSIPDMLSYLKAGLPVFTRISDVEAEPIGYDTAIGLWVDGFARDWSDFDQLHRFLDDGKLIAAVSSELHGRPKETFWRQLRETTLWQHPGFSICTDFPAEAEAFFA